MLTPMNTYMKMTMPYPMQMDESTRLITALTNSKNFDGLVFGSQIKNIQLLKKKIGLSGDKLEISSWLQKSFDDSLSYSIRLLLRKNKNCLDQVQK